MNRCPAFRRRLEAAILRAQARADREKVPIFILRGSVGFQTLTEAEALAYDPDAEPMAVAEPSRRRTTS